MITGKELTAGRNLVILTAALAMTAGCGRQTLMNEASLDQGLVIVLPGIDGRAFHNEGICHTLCNEKVEMAVELFDWTAPLGPLFNQMAHERNRQVAAEVAARIVEYRSENPDGQVILIGHSGGTAIAAWAAEALPADEQIDGIIMLASSLSPGYRLDAALARTRRGIVSFYSDLDAALLGAGTSLMGTMDRVNTVSAGKIGFETPAIGGEAYRKLVQIPWTPKMATLGHGGGHFSVCESRFVAAYVVPFVKSETWSSTLVAGAWQPGGIEVASAGGATAR